MPEEEEFKVKVSVEGLDDLAAKIAKQIQQAMGLVRTTGMVPKEVVGQANNETDPTMKKFNDSINRMSNVTAGWVREVYRVR